MMIARVSAIIIMVKHGNVMESIVSDLMRFMLVGAFKSGLIGTLIQEIA